MTDPITFPDRYLDRMRQLLGDEFDAFAASYQDHSTAGLRVNLLKTSPDHLDGLLPWEMTPVPWCGSGFFVPPGCRAGKHPLHAAGLYYLQEPSAMAVVEALDIRPGDRVIDVSAAPGGKATHISAHLQGSGLLVANDPIPGRIKPLGENLERWGAANLLLTNATIPQLADHLPGNFNRVLVDAPCSGEGMFRRTPAAITAWSEEHVRGSAIRQAALLADASRLVKPGGLLLYSTCTFAPEENEQRIDHFLRTHDGWTLSDIPALPGVDRGRSEWVDEPAADYAKTGRIWPHRSHGDGHFIALMQAPGDTSFDPSQASRVLDPGGVPAPIQNVWEAFRQESLPGFSLSGRIVHRGEHLFLAPAGLPATSGLRVVRPGLPLGTIRGKHFVPAHALALAITPTDAATRHDLTSDEVGRYLHGETIAAAGPQGWVVMTTDGFPLGWGKRSAGVIKNHYPRGLRW